VPFNKREDLHGLDLTALMSNDPCQSSLMKDEH
jgi:hypothetical protein